MADGRHFGNIGNAITRLLMEQLVCSGVVQGERGGTPLPQIFFGGPGGNAVPPNNITVIQ